MELAGKNDSIVCSAFYSKFGPWYFDKALAVPLWNSFIFRNLNKSLNIKDRERSEGFAC